MRRTGFHAVALAAILSIVACRQDARQDTTPATPPGTPAPGQPAAEAPQPGVGVGAQDTTDFVQRATQKNLAEIELSKMAQQRATNPQVRQYAQMMIDDHTKALTQLRQIAQRENLQVQEQLPEEQRQLRDRLQGLKGPEFDREYMNAMVEGHQEMHDLLEDRAGRVADRPATGVQQPTGTVGQPQQAEAELNQWASQTRPIVERHLERARELHGKVGQGQKPAPGAKP